MRPYLEVTHREEGEGVMGVIEQALRVLFAKVGGGGTKQTGIRNMSSVFWC